ncbi:Hypothetical protein, predicted transmembrane protein [Mycoplasmopsis bovigenitalium 51080]|uniref:Uncharacterized protein n=1 Tax=Mycoplasmopsis bovigenitalium 51080 TaxID=1188235 RepID=N9TV63_9BACT|nr:RDD family protein [Mycoplasmopsis bovigenitalium]ENY70019.1 Hypothetical protein, predicted transmembrane protein [Mycoplasmopsis bovigenitalium 51080]
MLLHKNSSFFRRFLANSIDFAVFSSIILIVYKLFNFNLQITMSKWYLFLSINLIICFILFIIFPWIFNLRSIGVFLTRLQILQTKNSNYFAQLFKNAFPSFWFYALLTVLFLCFIKPSEIANLHNLVNNINEQSWNIKFLTRLISSIVSLWTLINLLNYMLIFISKNKLSLYERVFNYRVVLIKHFTLTEKMSAFKLVPYTVKLPEIIFIKENHGE